MVSQPLLDSNTKSSLRFTPSPGFLTGGEYSVTVANGPELSSQLHNGTNEDKHRLWANEKESLQKQIQVITMFCVTV